MIYIPTPEQAFMLWAFMVIVGVYAYGCYLAGKALTKRDANNSILSSFIKYCPVIHYIYGVYRGDVWTNIKNDFKKI